MTIIVGLLMAFHSLWALDYTNHIFDGHGTKTDLNYLVSRVKAGDVILVGEQHGFYPHHQTQYDVVKNLQQAGFSVNVGMEHVPYTLQQELSDYVKGSMSEEDFLKQMNWRQSKYSSCLEYTENKGYEDLFVALPFDCYLPTMKLSETFNGGMVRAINLPRAITGKVSGQGIDSLTPEEKAYLPPNYEWGSESYYQRFREVILSFGGSHGKITEEMITNMFWAQSLWDDSMSWKSLDYLNSLPQHNNSVMVVIVGNFHAAYGDGLAARFKARGAKNVHIVSQTFVENATEAQINELLNDDIQEGSSGDLIVITNLQ